jgi:hypothetical protein
MTFSTIWDPDTPASPTLLDLLFDDMGLGEDDSLRSESPEDKGLAREACRNYFTGVIKGTEEIVGRSLSMGEINTQAYVFYDGYLAGLLRSSHPVHS